MCVCVLIPLEPEWQALAGSHCSVVVASCALAAEPSLPPQYGTSDMVTTRTLKLQEEIICSIKHCSV